MKKLITAFIAALAIGLVSAAEAPPAQAQVYCGHCCGRDVYGNLVIGCNLVQAYPCGNACECTNVPGVGVTCY